MNEEFGGVNKPAQKERNLGPWAASFVGSIIRFIFVSMGIAGLAELITAHAYGWRFWVVAVLCTATYALGAIIEFTGDYMLKKERK